MARFGPLVVAVRWATVAVGLALSALQDEGANRTGFLVLGIPLVAYAVLRTVRPLRYLTGDAATGSLLDVLAEVALSLAVVVATDYWASPYVFCLASAILAAGFARGFGFAIRTAGAAIAAVAIPYHLQVTGAEGSTTVQWGGELLLIALVAGYARRLFGEAEEQSAIARQANDLLSQLNAVAQALPASLDLDETVDTTIAQLREVFPIDVVAVLLWEDATDAWRVAAAEGVRLPSTLTSPQLPPPARDAVIAQRATRATTSDHALAGVGIVAAIYLPLVARDRLVGLIAIESRTAGQLTDQQLALGGAVATQAALALDNARWFQRLRTVGADEERTRIARDLHDRVGQSLAFVSFELDRISRHADDGSTVKDQLEELRNEVRNVVTEVRDTLYDLRTDVSERQDLVATLGAFLHRLQERHAELDIHFDFVADRRLPVRQEREIWRIAQEALTNALRHAGTTIIRVTWRCDDAGAVLEVIDGGIGLADGAVRADSYGIVGMRERAAAIGGRLELRTPREGPGTVVRLEVAG
ncbi:MAG TPA: sensor histidine kinase [Acidimicrobiales bacterium]|nr:sensor histidine kinase [Acidimicrobiales bacterium]